MGMFAFEQARRLEKEKAATGFDAAAALDDLTAAQLREKAESLGVKVPANTKKADIIALIEKVGG